MYRWVEVAEVGFMKGNEQDELIAQGRFCCNNLDLDRQSYDDWVVCEGNRWKLIHLSRLARTMCSELVTSGLDGEVEEWYIRMNFKKDMEEGFDVWGAWCSMLDG